MLFTGALHLQPAAHSAYSDRDPPDEIARRVGARCWPRVIVVNAAPDIGQRALRLAQAILEQLGKDPDLHGGTAATHENWSLAEIWLRAHDTTTLIVLGAEHLNARLWRRLAALTRSGEITVALISQTHALVQAQRQLLEPADGGSSISTVDHDTFCTWAEHQLQSPTTEPAGPATSRPAMFPAVPPDDVPFFRETCRRLLSHHDFAIVDDAYVEGFEHTQAWLDDPPAPLLEEHAGAFLADLVRHAGGIHEQLTLMRGAQSAFWRNGWLLKLRIDSLLAAHRTEPVGFDSAHAAHQLNGYTTPHIAALGVLALRTRLPPARLALINADQLTDDCTSLNLGDQTIQLPDGEARLLRAQVLNAGRHDHSPNGPLFCHKDGTRMRPHALQQHLRRAAAETGLRLTQHWSPPLDRQHTHWMHRRGLTLQRLAGHAPA